MHLYEKGKLKFGLEDRKTSQEVGRDGVRPWQQAASLSDMCACGWSLLHSRIILPHCDIPPNGRFQRNDWPLGARPPQVRSNIASLHLLLTFPLPGRCPWVMHTSPSLHSKPRSCGYLFSLLTLLCSTDTTWIGKKKKPSKQYLAHLYFLNMCLGSFPLHRHFFFFPVLRTLHLLRQKDEGEKKSTLITFGCFFSRLIKHLKLHRWLRSNYLLNDIQF